MDRMAGAMHIRKCGSEQAGEVVSEVRLLQHEEENCRSISCVAQPEAVATTRRLVRRSQCLRRCQTSHEKRRMI